MSFENAALAVVYSVVRVRRLLQKWREEGVVLPAIENTVCSVNKVKGFFLLFHSHSTKFSMPKWLQGAFLSQHVPRGRKTNFTFWWMKSACHHLRATWKSLEALDCTHLLPAETSMCLNPSARRTWESHRKPQWLLHQQPLLPQRWDCTRSQQKSYKYVQIKGQRENCPPGPCVQAIILVWPKCRKQNFLERKSERQAPGSLSRKVSLYLLHILWKLLPQEIVEIHSVIGFRKDHTNLWVVGP